MENLNNSDYVSIDSCILSKLKSNFGEISNIKHVKWWNVNKTYEFTVDGDVYILRIFPHFFQEKCYEAQYLELLSSYGYQVPKVSFYDLWGINNFICYEKIDWNDLLSDLWNIDNDKLFHIYNDVLNEIKSIWQTINVEHTWYLHEENFKGSFKTYLLKKIRTIRINFIRENNNTLIESCSYLTEKIRGANVMDGQLTLIDNQNKNIIVDKGIFKWIIDFDFLIWGDYLFWVSNMLIHDFFEENAKSCLKHNIKNIFTDEEIDKIYYFSIYRIIEYIDFLSNDVRLYKWLNERHGKKDYYINVLTNFLRDYE